MTALQRGKWDLPFPPLIDGCLVPATQATLQIHFPFQARGVPLGRRDKAPLRRKILLLLLRSCSSLPFSQLFVTVREFPSRFLSVSEAAALPSDISRRSPHGCAGEGSSLSRGFFFFFHANCLSLSHAVLRVPYYLLRRPLRLGNL